MGMGRARGKKGAKGGEEEKPEGALQRSKKKQPLSYCHVVQQSSLFYIIAILKKQNQNENENKNDNQNHYWD